MARRDKSRIAAVLYDLRLAWEKHPDWRLGQLVSNAMGAGQQDVFYTEDDDWQKMFRMLASDEPRVM